MTNANAESESEKKIRQMIRRRTTGIIMAVVMVALWFVQGWPLRIGFVFMMLCSMWEMYSAFVIKGARPIRWVGMAYAVLVVPVYLKYGMQTLLPLMAVCCMVGLAGVIIRGEIDFNSAVATLFPLFYPGMLITLVFPVQDIPSPLIARVALAMLFLVPLMNDLFAYEVGMRFGRRPLSPVLSPKKTVEGAVAGMAASVLFSILVPVCAQLLVSFAPPLMQYAVPLPPLWLFALCGLIGGAAALVGDLTASMVKRYCGIKDFGAIFPGHGGMLDRMDSVLFTSVVIYLFFVVFWRT